MLGEVEQMYLKLINDMSMQYYDYTVDVSYSIRFSLFIVNISKDNKPIKGKLYDFRLNVIPTPSTEQFDDSGNELKALIDNQWVSLKKSTDGNQVKYVIK